MIKNLTYHQRLLYTLIGGGLFAIIIYNVALSSTIDIAIDNNALEKQIAKNQDAPKQVEIVKQKIKKIEQLVGDREDEKVDIHQLLLASVTGYVQEKGMILKDLPQPYVATANGYVTNTAKITLEGDFISLLKLLYFLEGNYKVGKVVAVDFKTEKELQTRKRILNATIYLQNVKADKNEENT